jgi:signal transduction histidine kinase
LVVVDILAVALAAIAGAVLASRVLRPVELMRQESDRILGHELSRRLPAARDGDIERLRASADIVQHESHRMALTLRELLGLAEATATNNLHERVRLDLVAEDALREIQALAPDRVIQSDAVATTIVGDANRVHQLLVVLLDNAITYSPSDQPVELTITQRPGDGPIVRIRDHGAGLTDADRSSVWGRFARGSAARDVPGSGLGLAIALTVAERHHATLSLDPGSGGGTIAEVRFPADDAQLAQ